MAPIKFSPAQALLGILFAPQAIQSLTSLYPPFQSGIAEKAFQESPNLMPPPSELVGQRQKGIIDSGMFINRMMEIGYSPARAENMLANARTYLSALDYITAWRRDQLSEASLNETLQEQGLTSEDIATLKNVTIYYPTPQDLIRFAVRDVYTSQTISLYRLDEDYPDLLDETARKAGLTSEIAHQYWMAHWELPSPTQVYDMFHRKILTKDDAATYLKIADYMPYWRDKLIQLSYDPITRVDIRRMYAMGVINEAETTLRYEYLGYSPEDAALLTQFTVMEAKHSTESTSTSVTINAYKAGTIDKATALSQLQNAKVSDITAHEMIDNADAALKEELIGLEADAIADQYRNGAFDLGEFKTQLTKIGVPARLLQLTVERELAQSRKRAKTNTKADLDTWWKQGVIGPKLYTQRMELLGYAKADITLFLAELHLGELAGQDKKFPWGPAMRDYSDGNILADGLQTELNKVVKDAATVQTLIDIAKSIKG